MKAALAAYDEAEIGGGFEDGTGWGVGFGWAAGARDVAGPDMSNISPIEEVAAGEDFAALGVCAGEAEAKSPKSPKLLEKSGAAGRDGVGAWAGAAGLASKKLPPVTVAVEGADACRTDDGAGAEVLAYGAVCAAGCCIGVDEKLKPPKASLSPPNDCPPLDDCTGGFGSPPRD